MKKFIYLLLLIPFSVYAANSNTEVSSSLGFAECQIAHEQKKSAQGEGYILLCKKATCSNSTYTTSNLIMLNQSLVCGNGNTNYQFTIIKTGCTPYESVGATCTNGQSTKYCSYVAKYNCDKTNDGQDYYGRQTSIPVQTTTTTTTTTTKRTTQRTTRSTTTTTTTTTRIKSSNAYLSGIKLSSGEIAFNKDVFTYEINVNEGINYIDVEVSLEDTLASAKIENNENISTDVPIKITVTAEDGTTKEYQIKVNIIKNKSSDSSLSSITVEGYTLDFNKDTHDYVLEVKSNTTEVKVEAVASSDKAYYNINYPEEISNNSVIKIIVTAEDETTTEYTINIIKKEKSKSNSSVVTFLIVTIVVGILGVVVYKLAKRFLPARGDDKYDYE